MLGVIFWLAVVVCPCLLILGILVRGRRCPELPACPRCRHCVRGHPGSTCSECGCDLLERGVVESRRKRVGRGWRLLALLALAVIGFYFASALTWGLVGEFLFWNITPRWWHGGSSHMEISHLKRGPVTRIRVTYPGWIDPDVSTLNRSGTGSSMKSKRVEWLHGQEFPVRLDLTPVDGPTRAVLIEREGAQFELRAMPSPNGPDRPGRVIATTTKDQLQATIGSWLVEEGLAQTPETPIAGLADHMVVKMAKAASEYESSPANATTAPGSFSPGDIWDSTEWDKQVAYRDAVGWKGLSSSGGMSSIRDTQYVQPWMVLAPIWVLLWIIIGLFVLLPGTRMSPWTPAENG